MTAIINFARNHPIATTVTVPFISNYVLPEALYPWVMGPFSCLEAYLTGSTSGFSYASFAWGAQCAGYVLSSASSLDIPSTECVKRVAQKAFDQRDECILESLWSIQERSVPWDWDRQTVLGLNLAKEVATNRSKLDGQEEFQQFNCNFNPENMKRWDQSSFDQLDWVRDRLYHECTWRGRFFKRI